MEQAMSQLLQAYEKGKLSRRALLQGLALVAVSSAPVAAAGFRSDGINHVSLYVTDMTKSAAFYDRVFGAKITKRDGSTLVEFGKGRLVIRPGKPAGTVDHFAVGVGEKLDKVAVTADLKARGATAYAEGNELRVKDPDGFPIQLSAY
jgi:catechol 2,3-dioxygenase-like lactoylglutathione lyase family enzyme